jgi:omega-6 fatty acid desaturase (delta-12 desaturase)
MEQRLSPEPTIPSDRTSQPPGVRPTVPEVRGQVPADIRTRSLALGLAIFLVAGMLYALTFWGVLAAPAWPLQVVLALANGICIGTFFVVGHDACHGSLTPFSALNQGLGRLAFLPSLTPFTSWEFAHNRIHHAYTNLRSKDYAWAPFSKCEYDRLPPRRRWLERHYRSLGGLGTYYFIEYWLKHLLFLSRAEHRVMKRTFHFALDLLLVAGFAACEMAVIIAWSSSRCGTDHFWGPITARVGLLVLVWLLPFLIWNWSMGFAIFQHHNHPRIPWYDQRAEWDFFAGQVESTTHMQLPWFLEWVMAHIMQHTAHHVDPKIPLYRLPQSQRCLEQVYPQEIVVESWSIPGLIRTMARCKLYDYENHRWMNFDGRPTTEPHPRLRALREGSAAPRHRSP